MPGRTPREAFKHFIEPIQDALACLGSAKITTSANGTGNGPVSKNAKHSWVINKSRGMQRGDLALWASMEYRFVDRRQTDPDIAVSDRWKIRTASYIYKIRHQGHDASEWHWHPESSLNVRFPHMHLQSAVLTSDGLLSPRTHLPGGRTAFEQVIRILITDFGWPPQVDDWEERLTLHEGTFRLYSSWSAGPPPIIESS